jgi:Cu(I)/Ag(I) efflux system membrane fusion protein
MKKVILPVLFVAVAGFGAYFLFFKKGKSGPQPEKQKPLAIGQNTSTFNQSYNTLLAAYTNLKDALVAGDTAKASASARELAIASDSLKVSEIQGDTGGVIKQTAAIYTSTISGYAVGLAGEPTIKEKREEFELIADNLWQLTRTVKYDGAKLYWHYCPMAFNSRGAYWVSNEREIRNPYFGNDMLDCGKVADSLDYSAKK